MRTTWDGKPIHPEKPFGATIIVYRSRPGGPEFLVLHRTYGGPEYQGDWAWTPPSGARQPGETIEACAQRELTEETGLKLPLKPTDFGTEDWFVYIAKLVGEVHIRLSEEHDRFEWLNGEEAVKKCSPEAVSSPLRAVSLFLEDGEGAQAT